MNYFIGVATECKFYEAVQMDFHKINKNIDIG